MATVAIWALGACSARPPYDPYLGEANKSASAILHDSLNEFSSFYSVHEHGTETLEGTTVHADFVAGKQRGGGTITLGASTLNLVLQGNDLYIKTDAATWAQIGYESKAPNLANRWVHASADAQPFAAFAQKLDFRQLDFESQPLGNVIKKPGTTIDGIAVIPLQSSATGLTLYVQASGQPTLIAAADTGSAGVTVFDHYDTAEPPPVPTGAVDLDSIPAISQQ
ncbi:MAG TPA: hypothetical protein VFZ97_20005 [Acidimicrobiales bacterium]